MRTSDAHEYVSAIRNMTGEYLKESRASRGYTNLDDYLEGMCYVASDMSLMESPEFKKIYCIEKILERVHVNMGNPSYALLGEMIRTGDDAMDGKVTMNEYAKSILSIVPIVRRDMGSNNIMIPDSHMLYEYVQKNKIK